MLPRPSKVRGAIIKLRWVGAKSVSTHFASVLLQALGISKLINWLKDQHFGGNCRFSRWQRDHFVAAKLAASHYMHFAIGIGVSFLIGGMAMILNCGGPVWFIASDLLLAYIPMAFLGGFLAVRAQYSPDSSAPTITTSRFIQYPFVFRILRHELDS